MKQPPSLPPGWTSHWDASSGRYAFTEQQTGRTQWEPPTQGPPGPPGPYGGQPPSQPPPPGAARAMSPPGPGMSATLPMGRPPFPGQVPQGAGNRASMPPIGYGQLNNFSPAGPGIPPGSPMADAQPPRSVTPGAAPHPSHRKRHYPASQAYYGDSFDANAGGGGPMGNAAYGGVGVGQPGAQGVPPAAGGQFFSPAAGVGPNNFQQPGNAPPRYFSQGDPANQQFAPAAGPPGQGYPQPPYSAGVGGMSGQFAQMSLGNRKPNLPLSSQNLIGLQLNPANIEAPPPAILLPPATCVSQAPTANADPSYMRSTLNAIPVSQSLLNKSKLPLALIITPYRTIQPGDEEVPLVDDAVIARCRRCRTYINPFVTFIEGGQRWRCCMCNLPNDVPAAFDYDDQARRPRNRFERAELNHSVVEFLAPTEYMVRPPQAPTYIFLIDVSYPAISSGMVATAAQTLLKSLDRLPNEDNRTRVAIIGVNHALNFFCLPPGATEPSMLVMGDLQDVFLPTPNDLLMNLTESRAGIESLLGRFNDMFANAPQSDNAMGAALQAAQKLIINLGGKIVVLSASLTNVGPGALKMRDDYKLYGTSKESSLLNANDRFYKEFATQCQNHHISIDCWLFSAKYTDVATLSCLPRYTGGQTYFYPAFIADRNRVEDAEKFAHEFSEVLASPICLEAVMRVRPSKGIRLSNFYGNFFVRSSDLLALPAVPMNQSYAIEVQIEDPLNTPIAVFQTAVLHTTSFGQRRIRVVTLALPTTSVISELYASADQVAIATLLANKAVERGISSKLEDARDAVTNKVVDILSTYKSHMGTQGPSPQLIVPDNLKHLPMLLLGLVKHVGIRQSTKIPSDLRAYAMALLTTLPSQLLVPYLHPSFYALHTMPPDCGVPDDNGRIKLPPPLPLTSARFERHGLYLIEDGQNIFLWVGRDAVPQLVMDVFDAPSYVEFTPVGKQKIPTLDNPFSKRVNAVIGAVRTHRRSPYLPSLYVVKEDGDPQLRLWALSLLIEDRSEGLPSYNEWLNILKEKVNNS